MDSECNDHFILEENASCEPMTESILMDSSFDKPVPNGGSCGGHCLKTDVQDPWIPRSKISMSKYFCVKNEYSTQSTPQNNNLLCIKCNSSMKKTDATTQPNIVANVTTKTSKFKKIVQHFRKFCETTSLRGVPRVINTRRPKYRFLFAVFVTFFFIANFTCLFLLIKQFRAYDVIQQPKTDFNSATFFPSVTLCNLRPFSGRTVEYLKTNNMTTLNEFLKYSSKAFKSSMKHYNLGREFSFLQTATVSLNQFLMNLPLSVEVESIGHSERSMIIECRVTFVNGSELSAVMCDKAGKWILSINEVYLNCYTLTLSAEFIKIAMAVDLTLHLDDRFDFECPDCMPTLPLYQMTGIRFSLHSAHTYPDVLVEGNNLLPGTFTEAVFKSNEWNMMEAPYGKCSKSHIDTKYSFEEGDFVYSLASCYKYQIQQNLSAVCKCITYNNVPKNLVHLKKDKHLCTYIEQPVYKNVTNSKLSRQSLDRLFQRINCRKEVSHAFPNDYSICTIPCHFYTFPLTISSGTYPTKSYHLKFSQYVVRLLKRSITESKSETERNELQSIVEKLKIYDDISKEIKIGNLKVAEKMLRDADVIEKNFLTIQINRQSLATIKNEEKAVISITGLLSQAGGMFSIWSGITFFIIVEFIELLMKICDTIFETEE